MLSALVHPKLKYQFSTVSSISLGEIFALTSQVFTPSVDII